jgi:hypothetical protein
MPGSGRGLKTGVFGFRARQEKEGREMTDSTPETPGNIAPQNIVGEDVSPKNIVGEDESPNNIVGEDVSANNIVGEDESPNNIVGEDES